MGTKNIKKTLRNIIFFVLLIILTLWVLLKDQDAGKIFELIGQSNGIYISIGIVAMFIYLSLEAINLGRTLKLLGEKSNFLKNFKYALIGFFFSGITPAASGGQPMQIYYMHKESISVGHSTLALLINLTSVQISTISIALISVLFNYKFLNKPLIILFVIGIGLNMSALAVLLIAIFSRRLSRWLMKATIKIMKGLRIRKIDEKIKKIGKELRSYQKSAKYIKGNKKLMLKILGTTLIQYLVFYSISYWTYRALGFNESNIIQITTMQAVLYGSISAIPSPGAVGVSEGAFVEIFRNIYSENMIKSATLLNRGINFYVFMLISGIVVPVNDLRSKE